MKVQVVDDDNRIVWEHGISNSIRQGLTSKSYLSNGIQQSIITSLSIALEQANEEMQLNTEESKLAVFNNGDRVPDGRTTSSEVKNDIPVS